MSWVWAPQIAGAEEEAAPSSLREPTLERLKEKYPDGSAYILEEGEGDEAHTFCLYDIDAQNGDLIPRYYHYGLKTAVADASAYADTKQAFQWGQTGLKYISDYDPANDRADIVYGFETVWEISDSNHLSDGRGSFKPEFTLGTTVFGNVDAANTEEVRYHWEYEQFGTSERSGDAYRDWRWIFKSGNGTTNIVYQYAPDSTLERINNKDGVINVSSGVFVGRGDDTAHTTDGDYKEPQTVEAGSAGGAIYNAGTITGVVANDFVSNQARSIFTVGGGGGIFLDSPGKLNITNSSLGGAIYNAGTISEIKTEVFIGNSTYAEFFSLHGAHENSKGPIIIGQYALGGAIYNAGTIEDGISSSFIGNYAKSEHVAGASYLSGVGSMMFYASGGAIYNAGTIEGTILGSFIGNYAYSDHFSSVLGTIETMPIIATYAHGGAIYNGIGEMTREGLLFSVENIRGNFVGNFAYSVQPYLKETSNPDLNKGGVGDGYVQKSLAAAGGAIYNGIAGLGEKQISDEVEAHIGSIAGVFTGNYAYAKNYASILEKRSGTSTDFVDIYTTLWTNAAGGAIYNGLTGSKGIMINDGKINTYIGSINGLFTGNYAHARGISARDNEEGKLSAVGGAIYNGMAGFEEIENGKISSIIDSIYGEFTGNYVFAYGTLNVKKTPHYAQGGALYNGIAGIEDVKGEMVSSITSISANYSGNYAYTDSLINDGSTDSRLSGKTDYAQGGAIYNGVEGVSESDGKIRSTINSISGDFEGNYTYAGKAYNSYTVGYYETFNAGGGAIYNGVIGAIGNKGDIVSDIDSISSNFTGNYVKAKRARVRKVKYSDTYEARGGAIYNGAGNISENLGNVTSRIGSISGAFINNYAQAEHYYPSSTSTYSRGGLYTYPAIFFIAHGGAIYNGVEGMSDSNLGMLRTDIDSITGDFIENYVNPDYSKTDNDYIETAYDAAGGAIYNGIGVISGYDIPVDNDSGGSIGQYTDSNPYSKSTTVVNKPPLGYGNYATSDEYKEKSINRTVSNSGGIISAVGPITGDFIRNYAATKGDPGVASGGAIHNGVEGFEGISGTIENKLHISKYYMVEITGNNVDLAFRRGIEPGEEIYVRNAIPYTFTSEIDNAGNTIRSSVESITGDFIKNYAEAAVAQGGAIYNSIGSMSGGSRAINNLNKIVTGYSYQNITISPTISGRSNVSISYEDVFRQENTIDNAYNVTIDNSRGGEIGAHIGSITGDYIGNSAKGEETQGGAIYNSIGAINAGGGGGTNINGDPSMNASGTKRSYYTYNYDPAIKNSNNIQINYGGEFDKENTIRNEYGVTINNADGGQIGVSIGSIDGDFIDNSVTGETAHGGAMYNGIEDISGRNGKVENQNNIFYNYGGTYTGSTGVTNKYTGTNTDIYVIDNRYKGLINNEGGTIKTFIGKVEGDYIRNEAKGETTARGGAIYNGFESISASHVDITNTNTIEYVSITTDAAGVTSEYDKEINNHNSISNNINGTINNSKGGEIKALIEEIKSDFTENSAKEGAEAQGGAIYNGFGAISGVSGVVVNDNILVKAQALGDLKSNDNNSILNDISGTINNSNGGEIKALIEKIRSDFTRNSAEGKLAQGGAIYNGFGAIKDNDVATNGGDGITNQLNGVIDNRGGVIEAAIEDAAGNFTNNRVEAEEAALGGAIYNGIGSIIGSAGTIKNEGGEIRARIGEIGGVFRGNSAESESGDALGGAIYNGVEQSSGSVGGVMEAKIDKIAADFIGNQVESDAGEAQGGAIYNAGHIGEISASSEAQRGAVAGGFRGNIAGASGGAVYNEGVIGSIQETEFKGNQAPAGGSALTNTGRVGEIADDASTQNGDREYDNSIVGGVINTSFTNNVSEAAERTAAVYTETSLAIIARGGKEVEFRGNEVGDQGVTRDIYVAQGADIYMIAEKDSSITTWGEIAGDAAYTLRLRGYTERGAAREGGLVDFEGLVRQADVIMDDVTLKLGLAKNGEDYVVVHDDTLIHLDDDHELHPGDIGFDGSGGAVDAKPSAEEAGYRREYSDVLRESHLEARSGHVLADATQIVNYNIGTIVSYGRMSYDVENGGYYTDTKERYATWSVNIDLAERKATTFTTWVKDEAEPTRGYITLSGITISSTYDCDVDTAPEEDWESEISPYLDVTVQVINLIKPGENGEDATPADWAKEGDINSSAPLQLDLSLLKAKAEEEAYMDSNDVLCEGFSAATTKTFNDSVRIWGWRDNLAAWAELQKSGKEDPTYGKIFTILEGTQKLTRNLQRKEEKLLQEEKLKIQGSDPHKSTLDVNGKNLLAEVAAGQTLELNRIGVKNVGHQRTDNQGTLILDTLAVEPAWTIVNDREVIKRGDWGIGNTITTTQRAETRLPGKGEDYSAPERVGQKSAGVASSGISNELRLQAGVTRIEGTVEYQNIYHEEGAETYLNVYSEAATRGPAGEELSEGSGVTEAFENFYGNTLKMQGGDFWLNNLNSAELRLRELEIAGGTIHINSVTVDLAKSVGEGSMGRIWAFDNAEYAGAGRIVVEGADGAGLRLQRRDGQGVLRSGEERYYEGGEHYAIEVQFVNPEVAGAVTPFGEEGDYAEGTGQKVSTTHYKEGRNITYAVDYDYERGVYTYRRPVEPEIEDLTPDASVGPVVQAAGAVASMMQMNEYVFEHADLYSANIYNEQKARLRESRYRIVTPVKGKGGKNAAPRREAAAKAACSHKAGFKGGMWVRPYAGYEKLPLHRGPKVSNSLYGALVGGDTEVTEHKSGWASVFTAHAAYMGSTQRYSGRVSSARIRQNGGAVGATETFYKRNFYTAVTATLGTSTGHATTSAGAENFHMLLGGVATRSGYNVELCKGRFVLQPTLLMSYTMVKTNNYTNASGARIRSEALHTIELHPYVKMIMNTESCWQPYATVGYVQQLLGETKFRADDVRLPGMRINPYVEYSVGAQRTWADRYTIFGEVKGRHGGRNGVEVSAGMRCAW